MMRRIPLLGTSIRHRFVATFLLLGLVPLLAATAIIAQRSLESLENQSIMLQREIATGIADQLQAMIVSLERDLAVVDEVLGLADLDEAEQRTILANLLASQRMYQQLVLADADGWERIRVARDAAVVAADLSDRSVDEAFAVPRQEATIYFGPVIFGDAAHEPLTTISYPLIDRRSGGVEAVLIATVRFKPIWDLLAGLELADGAQVFIITADGLVLAHRNPAVVLSGATYSLPESSGRTVGLDGGDTVTAVAPIALGDESIYAVAEEPVASAFALVVNALRVTGIVVVLTVAIATALAIAGARWFVKPMEELAASARRVADGHLLERVPVRTDDEIGSLASAFNEMTGRLQAAFESLELRVAQRTAELEGATIRQQELIAELEASNNEMARVQEQLQELIRSKDEFLGAVSHELRTPLTSVLGFAGVLTESLSDIDDAELEEFISRIADQGQDMADIVNDLLVAAKADSGELFIDTRPLDLSEGIRTVVKHFPDVPARVELPSEQVGVLADPVRLRQIMRNLVVNAGRYGGSEVEIGVTRNKQRVVVQVRDNGFGVPEDEWETIFDPYRTSHSRNGQPASVGLGLTVSRMLARRMEGDLTYRYEDAKSVFELTLPAAEPH